MKRVLWWIPVFLFILPGCGRLIDWSKHTFVQVNIHERDDQLILSHIRNIRVYDQFATIGMFDILWVSDDIRKQYAHVYSAMQGQNDTTAQQFLTNQLNINKDAITFYVLTTDKTPLCGDPAPWSMSLLINNKKYMPTMVKVVELHPVYESFFGHLITNHKRSYEIVFCRKDENNKDILDQATEITVYFSNPKYFSSATWNCNLQKMKKSPMKHIKRHYKS